MVLSVAFTATKTDDRRNDWVKGRGEQSHVGMIVQVVTDVLGDLGSCWGLRPMCKE